MHASEVGTHAHTQTHRHSGQCSCKRAHNSSETCRPMHTSKVGTHSQDVAHATEHTTAVRPAGKCTQARWARTHRTVLTQTSRPVSQANTCKAHTPRTSLTQTTDTAPISNMQGMLTHMTLKRHSHGTHTALTSNGNHLASHGTHMILTWQSHNTQMALTRHSHQMVLTRPHTALTYDSLGTHTALTRHSH